MTFTGWLFSVLFSAPPTSTYTGLWLTASQDDVIEVSRQGQGFVGRFVAFRQNPVAKKKLLNSYVFHCMTLEAGKLNGKIIDPRTGKSYRATLHLTSPQTLELQVKPMGVTIHTETWTRQLTRR